MSNHENPSVIDLHPASDKTTTHATNRMDMSTPKQPTSLRQTCADINSRVERFLSIPSPDEVTHRTQEQTRVAIDVIAKALRDFEFEALSLSYNGGKDCLVLLILYLSVLHTHFTQPSGRRKASDDSRQTASIVGVGTGLRDSKDNDEDDFPTTIPSIYAKPPDPFDSVTSFVESSTHDYHLSLTHISTNPGSKPKANSHSSPPPTSHSNLVAAEAELHNNSTNDKDTIRTPTSTPQYSSTATAPLPSHTTAPIITFRDAFALYLQTHPSIRAIFVGTRRTDPHGATLQHFQMTDGNWPRFMRIHPVIDWHLSEIWCFLRSEYMAGPATGIKLEYCVMYDEGYTSLGGVGDTVKNPRLKHVDANGQERYRPAYEMTEDGDERAGRE